LSEAGVKRTLDQCIEQTMLADQLGDRSVWFTEHHFLPGFSYSSSSELVLSHLAAKTKNILPDTGSCCCPLASIIPCGWPNESRLFNQQ
jgi:alkanesulfonate monooxygenase SsuD/methylene tetrahydromethanopterin reductase-like flavin-dependent oxidoreductase (luciferase family)